MRLVVALLLAAITAAFLIGLTGTLIRRLQETDDSHWGQQMKKI